MLLKDRSKPESVLDRVPLFRNLTKDQLQRVGRVTTQTREEPGTVLARQGQRGVEFVLILDGTATVERDGKVVATIGQGDFFGEVSLLDGGPRTATVTAETPMELLVVDPRGFRPLLETVPGLQRKIMINLCTRLREMYASHTH